MTLRESSKTVHDYKIEQADRFSLGMAINNAAILRAGYTFDRIHLEKESMKALIKDLFELYKEIRKEELGY